MNIKTVCRNMETTKTIKCLGNVEAVTSSSENDHDWRNSSSASLSSRMNHQSSSIDSIDYSTRSSSWLNNCKDKLEGSITSTSSCSSDCNKQSTSIDNRDGGFGDYQSHPPRVPRIPRSSFSGFQSSEFGKHRRFTPSYLSDERNSQSSFDNESLATSWIFPVESSTINERVKEEEQEDEEGEQKKEKEDQRAFFTDNETPPVANNTAALRARFPIESRIGGRKCSWNSEESVTAVVDRVQRILRDGSSSSAWQSRIPRLGSFTGASFEQVLEFTENMDGGNDKIDGARINKTPSYTLREICADDWNDSGSTSMKSENIFWIDDNLESKLVIPLDGCIDDNLLTLLQESNQTNTDNDCFVPLTENISSNTSSGVGQRTFSFRLGSESKQVSLQLPPNVPHSGSSFGLRINPQKSTEFVVMTQPKDANSVHQRKFQRANSGSKKCVVVVEPTDNAATEQSAAIRLSGSSALKRLWTRDEQKLKMQRDQQRRDLLSWFKRNKPVLDRR